jgi:hypothetical protein
MGIKITPAVAKSQLRDWRFEGSDPERPSLTLRLADNTLIEIDDPQTVIGIRLACGEFLAEHARRRRQQRPAGHGAVGVNDAVLPACTCPIGGPFIEICPTHFEESTDG